MIIARRLVALTATGLLAGAALVAAPAAQGAAGKIAYACTIPSFGTQNIDIALSTDAPDTMAVGQTFTPELSLSVTVPALIVGLAGPAGYTHASAEGTLQVGIGGAPTQLAATYEKTPIPSGFSDFTVTMKVPLPVLAPTAPGTITYTPGPLNATLSIYKGADGTAESVEASCKLKDPGSAPVIDTVTVTSGTPASAASQTTLAAPATTYGKAGVVTVRVGAAGSGATAGTGTVTLSGAGAAQTRTVQGGKAVFTLPRTLRARSYALKAVYSGGAGLSGSQATRTLVVRKGAVGGFRFNVTTKPRAKKTGAATVRVLPPAGLANPTGAVTVVLRKGKATKRVAATLVGGKRAVVLPRLAKGTWTAKIAYAGNANYRPSTSAAVALTITR